MMAATLFAVVLGVATFFALLDWRRGVLAAILAGLVQDPIRKLTPGTPVIFVLASLPLWAACFVSASSREANMFGALRSRWPRVWQAILLLLLALFPAALVTLQYGADAWRLASLGVLSYVMPLAALVMGFAYARAAAEVLRLFTAYCLMAAPMLIGAVLEYWELTPEWAAVGAEALGAQWVRSTASGPVPLVSGFFRSPDLLGWHSATVVMLGGTILISRGMRRWPVWLPVLLLGSLSLLLCGRRKMLMMPVVWLGVMVATLLRRGRRGAVASVALALGVFVGMLHFAAGEVDVQESYYVYAGTVASEGPERLYRSVIGSVWGTYRQVGALGKGIGTASTGVRHAGVTTESWQESGPSKLMVELGVPGLVFATLLVAILARTLMQALRETPPGAPLALETGLIGVLAANAACFIVSHQAYSDAVALALTALLIGVALSSTRWSRQPVSARAAPRPTMRRP
jgi:hypothetical protein